MCAVYWERVANSLNSLLDELLQYTREERVEEGGSGGGGLALSAGGTANNPIQHQFHRLKQVTQT